MARATSQVWVVTVARAIATARTIAATPAIHVATALRNLNHPIDTLGPLYLAEDILLESPHFAAGFAVAPEAPGLGIELDLKKVEKYRIA